MKKIIIIILTIVIISSFVIKNNNKQAFEEIYNISYSKREMGIVFILNDNINAVLINNDYNENDLIILDYDNVDKLKKEFKTFNIPSLKNIYSINSKNIEINNVKSKMIKPKNNVLEFKYNDKNFCIYINSNEENNILDCNFMYMYKFNNNSSFMFSDKILTVFQNYNNTLSTKIQETLYQDWIDTYTIDNNSITILRLLNNGFNTFVIPIIK